MYVRALAVVVLIVFAVGSAAAEEKPALRTISVMGTGSVIATPDAAEISAGVVSTGVTAAEALAENTKRMSAVFEGLKALGVADRELRTSGFSVSPIYRRQSRDSGEPPAVAGYRVSNIVHVRLRDAGDVGRVLDRVVGLGANNVNSVRFVVSDRDDKLQAALADAVKNARERAGLMAAAAGATLGPVIEIREDVGPGPRPVFAMAARAEAADVPVSAGEETLQVSVQAIFALD